MTNDDDKRGRDAFNPGVTRNQIEQAEKMLGGLDMPMFVEKRNLGQELRPGVLHGLGGAAVRADVKISIDPIDPGGPHVVLSREALPSLRSAEISIEYQGRVKILTGALEQSRPGRRSDDSLNGDVLKISFFFPTGR